MSSWTSADFITAVKNQETIPDSGAAYSDATLLQFIDFAKNEIVGIIESVKQDYLIETLDVQLSKVTGSPINGVPTNVDNVIMIPNYASGLSLHDVTIVGSDGSFNDLPRLTAKQASSVGYYNWNTDSSDSYNISGVYGFYLQGQQIQIFPYTIAQGKRIRLSFRRDPPPMCLIENAAQVLSVTGDTIQIGNVPSWNTLTHLCVVSNTLPNQYVIDVSIPTPVYCTPTYITDFTPVAYVGNVLTLPVGLATNIQIGDWICPTDSSVFAMNIPRNFYPALVQRAGAYAMNATADKSSIDMAMNNYQLMIKQALTQISPRVDSKPIRMIGQNTAFGAARRNVFGR